MKQSIILFGLLTQVVVGLSQTISQNPSTPLSDKAVCPGEAISYTVSGFGSCTKVWTITNGEITPANATTTGNVTVVSVKWKDVPGKGTLTVTLSGCGGGTLEGTTVTVSHVILSVAGQVFDPLGYNTAPRPVDFCNPAQVDLYVSHMYVKGTGGLTEPPRQEVNYEWTLPTGWRSVTGATGTISSPFNFISIVPIGCAIKGDVFVKGVIANCTTPSKSTAAKFELVAAVPSPSISPQQGYIGGKLCNTNPVTFTASLNVALGCISSYTWNFPSSWSGPITTSSNTVTRTPDGTPNIASPISVTVNFTCGTSITSGLFTPTFTPLALSGPDIVCSSGLFSLANAEFVPIGNVSWNVTPSTLVTPASGSGTLNASISKVASGSATFTYTATCNAASISVSKSTFVGTYGSGDVSWVGPTSSTLCRNQYYYPTANLMPQATSYDWITSAGWFVSGQGTRFLTIRPPATGSGYIGLRVNNVCGVGGPSYKTQGYGVVSCGGALAAASPNPASNKLNVSVIESETTTAEIQEVKLYDKQGSLVREFAEKGKVLELNLEGLPRGMYFLSIMINGEISKERLMIEY